MLLQLTIEGFEWVLGIGLMFGLALVMSHLTRKTLSCFFIWLTVFNGFVVWGGLLPLWTLIVCVIVLIIIMYSEMTTNKGDIT